MTHAGEESSTTAQQLSACHAQMAHLLSEMGTAMHSVTKLTLEVTHQGPTTTTPLTQAPLLLDTTLEQARQEREQQLDTRIRTVSVGVLSSLPAAVPNLTTLSLRGSQTCDVAMKLFGDSCPLLVALEVEAIEVPYSAIQCFSWYLPNLTTLTLWSRAAREPSQWRLANFLDVVFTRAWQSKTLTALHLDFLPSITLRTDSGCWDTLPKSLEFVRCTCKIAYSGGYEALVRRVPRLSLWHCPIESLRSFHTGDDPDSFCRGIEQDGGGM